MLQRAIVILFVAGLVTAGLAAAPAWGETYHSQYSIGCTNIWPAVKATLGDQEHYAKVVINDEKMKADYQPKHTVHVDISGTLLQRMNHVTLKAKGMAAARWTWSRTTAAGGTTISRTSRSGWIRT